MNTPTPEDRELAEKLDAMSRFPSETGRTQVNTKAVARMIADHCAPLRELAEIGRLAVEERKAWLYQGETAAEYLQLERLDEATDAYLAKGRKA
jgi:hypothetical protein